MAPGMVEPLSIDAEQQQGPAREASRSPWRAFGLGVLVGGLACAGLALMALSGEEALAAADMVTNFAGPVVPLPSPARSGLSFGRAAAPAYGRDVTMTAGVTADPPAVAEPTAVRLKAERYIATNRFFVKEGKQAQFEERWATRKSRLAELDGFSSFALLRRTNAGSEEPNYVSFTVWEDVEAFTEWRQGSAFKEAHGGGSLWGFLQAILVNSRILSGAPKPAFYDGLLPVTPPVKNMPEAVDGWRNVDADGVNKLPAEMVVAMKRFKIETDTEEFEQAFKVEEYNLKEVDGFVSSYMLRRDAPAADDGNNYVFAMVWQDKAAFEAWRDAEKAKETTPLAKYPQDMAVYEGILSLYAPDYNAKNAAPATP